MIFDLKEKHFQFKEKINKWSIENLSNDINLNIDLINNLKQNNIAGFISPKAFGFKDKDFLHFSLSIQEISKTNPKISLEFIANFFFEQALINFGSKNQILKYITEIENKNMLATFAITNSSNNFNIENTGYTVEKLNNSYVLNGKNYCEYNIKNSNLFLIFASNKENKNYSVFIIDKNMNGISVDSKNNYLILKDLVISDDNLLGSFGEGQKVILRTFKDIHIAIASHYLGICEKTYKEIVHYFNQNSALLNDINLMDNFTNLTIKLENLRLLTYKAAELKSNGINDTNDCTYAKKYSVELATELSHLFINLSSNDKLKLNNLRIKQDFSFGNIFIQDMENSNSIILDNIFDCYIGDNLISNRNLNFSKHRKLIVYEELSEENIDKIASEIANILSNQNISEDKILEIDKSENIISFGLGIEDRENIKYIEDLARVTNASITCTRPIAEELEWFPMDKYLGTTGISFSGKMYIGIGLSGSQHHLNGLKNVETIIAINNDRHAKIFNNCDYGIVGDFKEIIPSLINSIKFKIK